MNTFRYVAVSAVATVLLVLPLHSANAFFFPFFGPRYYAPIVAPYAYPYHAPYYHHHYYPRRIARDYDRTWRRFYRDYDRAARDGEIEQGELRPLYSYRRYGGMFPAAMPYHGPFGYGPGLGYGYGPIAPPPLPIVNPPEPPDMPEPPRFGWYD